MTDDTSNGAHVPALLTDLPRWLRWRLGSDHGKPTKRPDCSTRDPTALRSFDAVHACRRTQEEGIGFSLTGGVLVGRYHLVALDIDGCRSPDTGVVEQWALDILAAYATYCEVTPSKTGLRLWLLVLRLPHFIRSRVHVDHPAPAGVTKRPEIQLFGLGPAGYVTVTGWALGQPAEIAKFEDLEWLVAQFDLRGGVLWEEVELPKGVGEPPSDDEIERRVRQEPRSAELLAGNWKRDDKDTQSASEAFYHLVCLVLRAAKNHGETAVNFLLNRTAWGQGLIDDSRDPMKYTRREWVARDVARAAVKTVGPAATQVFEPLHSESVYIPTPSDLLLTHEEFLRRRSAQRFLVNGLLPRTGLVQIYGDPSAGKTPFALSLALHVAGGCPTWFEHTIDVHGVVAYIVGEDANGLGWRAQAEQEALGVDLDQLYRRLLWSSRPAQLCDATDVAKWAEELKRLSPDGIAVLVVDTQAQNFGAGNENDTQDMSRFAQNLAALARVLGCLVVLVHHTGHLHKERARGSSVLWGALDASFEVTRDGDVVTATPRKAKNWRMPEPLVGTLVVREVGVDDQGRPLTAITLATSPPDPNAVLAATAGELEADATLRAVLAAVAESQGAPAPTRVLAAKAGCSPARAQRALQRLREIGRVRQVQAGSAHVGSRYEVVGDVDAEGSDLLL